MTLGHELKDLDSIKSLGLVVAKNDSWLSDQESRCYEQLMVMDDINNFYCDLCWVPPIASFTCLGSRKVHATIIKAL